MNYDLNKKRFFKVLLIIFLVLCFILFADFLFIISDSPDKIKITSKLLVIGIPIFVLFTGAFAIVYTIYLNIRILLYNSKNVLEIKSDSVTYNTFLYKKIEIKKENVEKIHATIHCDDLVVRNKYIVITTKNELPIMHSNSFFNLSTLLRLSSSNKKKLFINVSEIKGNPEKIAFKIEQALNVPINKKNKNLYFENKYITDKI